MMEDLEAATLACLERVICRDREKGGTGSRSTSEVAQLVGLPTARARVVLKRLSAKGLVDAYDSSDENSGVPNYEWRLAGYEWDEVAELHRVNGKACLSWDDLAERRVRSAI